MAGAVANDRPQLARLSDLQDEAHRGDGDRRDRRAGDVRRRHDDRVVGGVGTGGGNEQRYGGEQRETRGAEEELRVGRHRKDSVRDVPESNPTCLVTAYEALTPR